MLDMKETEYFPHYFPLKNLKESQVYSNPRVEKLRLMLPIFSLFMKERHLINIWTKFDENLLRRSF